MWAIKEKIAFHTIYAEKRTACERYVEASQKVIWTIFLRLPTIVGSGWQYKTVSDIKSWLYRIIFKWLRSKEAYVALSNPWYEYFYTRLLLILCKIATIIFMFFCTDKSGTIHGWHVHLSTEDLLANWFLKSFFLVRISTIVIYQKR